jgi:hypothetical protein
MSVISSVYTSNVRSAVYTSKTLNIVDSDCKDRNSFGVKAGVFKLNGKEVIVEKGETLESLSKKINKHLSTTGIKATIVEKDNGYKLRLTSGNNKPVQIFDPKGVLKNLYDKNHIGNSSKHLIQVIGGELYYNKSLPSQSLIKPLLKLNKQYSPEPNLFVENTLVNLNEEGEDQFSAIEDDYAYSESDSSFSEFVDVVSSDKKTSFGPLLADNQLLLNDYEDQGLSSDNDSYDSDSALLIEEKGKSVVQENNNQKQYSSWQWLKNKGNELIKGGKKIAKEVVNFMKEV